MRPHQQLSLLLPLLLVHFLPPSILGSTPCLARHYPTGLVCVCNSTYCDELDPPTGAWINAGQAQVYTSSLSGKRFHHSVENMHFADEPVAVKFDAEIEFDPEVKFQEILGFGGAFTDSVGLNLKSLSSATRKKLLKSYFDQSSGIGYTLGRVPMASCDFSTRIYSYCDVDGDFGLANFSLAQEDIQLKIPFVHEAIWLTNGRLRLFASPWSAPAWMKETGRMQGGGQLKGRLNGQYYSTWADYFVRFFEEYQKRGVQFWGLTVQNEPSAGLLKWYSFQAMYYSASMQRDFVRDLLGPHLRHNSASAGLKVMINDDNRVFLPSHPDIIFEDKKAGGYIDGVAIHWYWNKLFSADRLTTTHERHPDKFILPTEACNGWDPIFTRKKGVLLGDWRRGEKYARDIIENLDHWAVGWTDWNLCLDERGGPSWVGNWVDSPVVVNGTGDEFYKQPMFYAIGHFSKFIRPGSVRIGMRLKHGFHWADFGLAAIAVLSPGGGNQLVLVLQNRHSSNDYRVRVVKPGEEGRWLDLLVEHNSLQTILLQL